MQYQFYQFLRFVYFYGCTRGTWKFPCQGLNPSCSWGHTRSFNPLLRAGDQILTSALTEATAVGLLTHCAIAGTLAQTFMDCRCSGPQPWWIYPRLLRRHSLVPLPKLRTNERSGASAKKFTPLEKSELKGMLLFNLFSHLQVTCISRLCLDTEPWFQVSRQCTIRQSTSERSLNVHNLPTAFELPPDTLCLLP